MWHYFIKRILQLLLAIFGVTFITFGLTTISPSDPAEVRLLANDQIPSEEALEKLREEMGLNDPFLAQYGDWLKGILRGDLGYSYRYSAPVADVLDQKVPITLELAAAALGLFLVLSICLGVLAAIHKNKLLDYCIRGFSFISISIPAFWLGLILLYYFAVKLNWFSVTKSDSFSSIVLPALTLAFPLIGKYARLIRSEILEQLSHDYVIGARTNGVKEHRIIFRYVLPNALISILPLFGLSMAALLGGTVIVENIFSWQGLGSMALEAITYRDYALLQAYVLLMTVIYVSINFIVDVLVQVLDPRILSVGGNR